MRILLVGQAAFAEEVLRGLEAAGDTIAAVVCPPDAGPKPDPVKGAALARGIPVHQFRSLKAPEAQHAFAEARADLGVLAYVTQIVPEPLLHIPRLTSICFHPSLLPRYRGGSAIAWQLIRGETESGVTVFWPDAGIDTGRSEEHTSELQSLAYLVCRLLLEKKKTNDTHTPNPN